MFYLSFDIVSSFTTLVRTSLCFFLRSLYWSAGDTYSVSDSHDVRVEGFIYGSGCCYLESIFKIDFDSKSILKPIYPSIDFANARALRKAIQEADPGTYSSYPDLGHP